MTGGVDVHTHLAPRLGVAGPPELHRPDALVAHLDAVGLDEAIVSVPPPYFGQELDTVDSQRWAAEVNEGLAALVGGRHRLRALAFLPVHEPAAARHEYDRVRAQPWWAGVGMAAGGRTPSLAGAAFDPLWSALDGDGRTVLLHPAFSPDRRLDEFYLANLLGNPVETAVAAAQLVFGDVPARYPRIRFILVHCGGAVPAVVGRWEKGIATARPGVRPLRLGPREAVRRMWVDCLGHDPAVVDLAVTVFGADRILVGSDWPFPMGTTDPLGRLAHRGPEFVRQAATSNAADALGT